MEASQEDFSEVEVLISKLPRFIKLDHEKLYFRVFDKVEILNQDQRERYRSILPSFVDHSEKELSKLNKLYGIYGISALVLSIISMYTLGSNNPVSFTCITLLLLLFASMIFSGFHHYWPIRIRLIYSRIIRSVLEDIRKGKSRSEMEKTFKLLDDLTKIL